MARIDIRGVMVPNDYAWWYRYLDEDCTCPKDVRDAIDALGEGEDLDVYINSGGGVIDVGSEIYALLREVSAKTNVKIHITGEACSAASVAAMAAWCEMAPTALMMVHCVSTYGGGNHNDFEHTAEMLRTADKAMCSAYTEKTGMTEEEALDMMEHETWLTAAQAKEKGLIDAVMFEEPEIGAFTNSVGFKLPTVDQMEAVKRLMANSEPQKTEETETLVKDGAIARLNFLRLTNRRN